MTEKLDPFQLLGLPRNADAGAVRQAYVRLLKRANLSGPDNPLPPADHLARLQAAYELLRDDERRDGYEAALFPADAIHVRRQRQTRRRVRRLDRARAKRWQYRGVLLAGVALIAATCLTYAVFG